MGSRKDSSIGCEEIMVRKWLWRGEYQPKEQKEMLAAYMADRVILRLHRRLGGFIKLSWFFGFLGFAGLILGLVSGLGIPFSVYVSVVVTVLSFVSACLLEVWRKTVAPVGESIALTIFNDIEAFEREFDVDVTVMSEKQVREKVMFRFLMHKSFSVRYSNHPDLVQAGVVQLKWVQSLAAPFYDLEELC